MPEIYHPGYFTVEIHHRDANKAAMVAWLADCLAVPPQAITAFGDNVNDLPMFAVAGRRIAVANAHAAVRTAASEIIASNDAGGVARYIAATWRR